MAASIIHHTIFRNLILGFISIFPSCTEQAGAAKNLNTEKISSKPYQDIDWADDMNDTTVYYLDTVTVQSADELIRQIRSDRLIKLVNQTYYLPSTLLIDRIKNLKIVGSGLSKLMIEGQDAMVIKLLNSRDIHLDSLAIGHNKSPGHTGEHGVMKISASHDINISNCQLFGAGTFGLITNDVYQLQFINSEITECTLLIFELENSRKIEFIDSKFHNNNLRTSVLGAFTYSTREVTFLNCQFHDNQPEQPGNPAFNFMENWKDFDEPIIFTNCTFKNNKGFKWDGSKIKLNNCQIDSTDFMGFPENK